MRDVIFILILLAMLALGVYHARTEAWVELSIDGFVFFYALRTWRPLRRR